MFTVKLAQNDLFPLLVKDNGTLLLFTLSLKRVHFSEEDFFE